MTETERAPHIQNWIAAVVSHSRASGGKKPALMKYHSNDPVKELERAIADVKLMVGDHTSRGRMCTHFRHV
jgi:hypothetical protein